MINNIYEYFKTNNITNDECIIECGGHIGTDTQKLAKLFNNNIIYCIEANVNLIDKYLSPLKYIYDNINIYNLGLSNKDEIKTFYIDTDPNGDTGASSFLQANKNGGLGHLYEIEKPLSVNCIKLDTFLNENNIKNVYLLWLDVEQYEFYILNSCSIETFEKIKYIYTEVNFQEFRYNGKTYKDVKNLLEKHNFQEIFKTAQGDDNYRWQANVLFKNIKYKI